MHCIYRITNKLNGKTYIGKHWYNNGIVQCKAYECPEGYVKGRIR